MEITDLPLECQLLILEKLTPSNVTTLRNIHQVSKQWHDLAASSQVICSRLSLPALYGTRLPWDYIVRWSQRRAGLVRFLQLQTFPAKDANNAALQVTTELNEMRLAERRLSEVLQYAVPSITRLWISDSAHKYDFKVSVASLLGPAMSLFSNLREIKACWAGDGLERTHLNCLQDVPLLERLKVTYTGNVDLGPHFPEGLGRLRFLSGLHLAVSSEAAQHQTSLCSLPDELSKLSSLTYLFLERYFDHVETHALLHLTSLRHLGLRENPTKNPSIAHWVHNLPTSLVTLTVSGNASIWAGMNFAPQRRLRRLRTIPCVSGLSGLTQLSVKFLRGFDVRGWNDRSYLTGLSMLRSLEMSLCQLHLVPNAVVGLSSLRQLCLGGNKLGSLPVGPYLQNVEVLILVDNRFCNVPVEALGAATALTRLTMGGNPLAWTAAEAEFVKRIKNFTRTHQDRYSPPWMLSC